MMLACARAVDFLASHPSWDRRTAVVCGNSQGGLQAIAAAALNPSATAVVVNVPAGCDTAAPLAGRALSWPYWLKNTTAENRDAILNTASYFDAIHFAPRVKCPVLAGIGLIDQTARPDGILAMAARLAGPRELVLMPDTDHKGRNGTFAPFLRREKAWLEALKAGKPPPTAAADSPAR
jgi:cephalosporin-C deacetylase-like acetyl esterase